MECEQCCICCEDMRPDNDELHTTECGHDMHRECFLNLCDRGDGAWAFSIDDPILTHGILAPICRLVACPLCRAWLPGAILSRENITPRFCRYFEILVSNGYGVTLHEFHHLVKLYRQSQLTEEAFFALILAVAFTEESST